MRAIHHNKRLLSPKRRPPRPQQPIFGVFHRGGLHFERHTASRRGFTTTKREFCIIRTPARRQPAPNSVKSHRHRCREHGTIGRACCGAGGRRRGLAGLRDDAPSNVSHHSPTGVECAGGIGGPGCGARGRRGLDGLRDDAPINVSHHSPTGVEGAAGIGGSAVVLVGGGGAWPGFETTRRATSATTAPPVWRVPEGPEGQGGPRDAAPNAVRTPSLAGGRALRHPEHPWGAHSSPEHPWGAHSSPAPRARERQQGPEAPQRLGPHTHVRQLLTG